RCYHARYLWLGEDEKRAGNQKEGIRHPGQDRLVVIVRWRLGLCQCGEDHHWYEDRNAPHQIPGVS
ncbi:MAG: hypothetical protein ACK5XQ_01945, partial [Flavobacteriales bacterium]